MNTRCIRSQRSGSFLMTPMMGLLSIIGSLVFVGAAAIAVTPTAWPGFRGDGTSRSSQPGPAELKEGEAGNLAWQLVMPGRSVAGPIVVGDLVVATSSSGQDGEVLHISGVDLNSGQQRWHQTFRATGRPFCHPTSANAAPSPASDGERIFAFFSSNDLVCLSLEGELIWYRGLGYDYPQAGNDIGMASSPFVIDGAVIVQVEAQGDSFAAGIDAQTGENLWRVDRPKVSNWTSPIAVPRPDQSNQVILQSRTGVVAVDPRTGDERWRVDEPFGAVASPTLANDRLLIAGDDVVALDIASSASMPEVIWRNNKLTPKNASVVVGDDRLYALKGSVLVAANLEDGEMIWQQRLSGLGGTWATPVLGGKLIYIFDQSGKGLVIEDLGDTAATISEIELEEGVLASPALVNGKLIVRSHTMLHCFE